MAYLLQWVMIYYFGINTDLRIDPIPIPYTGKGLNLDLFGNQYLFQKCLVSPTLENHKHPIDSRCKNLTACHTSNIHTNIHMTNYLDQSGIMCAVS